jgi:hypothetical protein
MKTLLTLSALSQNETLRKIAHDLRVVNAVYHIETDSFGPDDREERTIVGRKILSNLFQLGTALVVSQNGTRVVSARDASRAAASVALRDIRMGNIPQHDYEVTMTNRRGQSHSETVHFGFDHAPIQDTDSDGDARANIDRLDMGHVSNRRIDDVSLDSETVAGRSQNETELENFNMDRANARQARDAAISAGKYAEWVSQLETQVRNETRD